MPCPHNEITIVQRSQRQSAVAAAAYQSGERLFCEYDQQVKHYPEKRGIVINSKFIRCVPPFSLLVWINNGGSQPQPPGSSACTHAGISGIIRCK